MDVEDAKDLERFIKDKRRTQAKNRLNETAQLCNCIGEIYSKYGRYEDAIQEHTQERHLSEALGDKIGEAVACRKIGECLCALGQYKEALELQKRHLTIARECGNHLEEQRAWATIGRTYLSQSETRNLQESLLASKKAEKAFVKALEACDKVKTSVKLSEYMAMKGRIYLNIGLVYDIRGETKLSADVLKRAVTIAEKFKLEDELFMCHSSLANMYQKSNNYSQALRSLEVALRLAEKLRNKVWEREMYVQKATVLVSTGDFLAAKHCLKKAHKLRIDSDISEKKLAKMFCSVNKMQEAVQDLATETDERKAAKLYETVADCSAEFGSYTEAIENYLKVIEFSHLLSSDERAAIYVSLAQSYADIQQYDNAILYYNHELEERKDNPEQMCRTLLNIAELEELKGSKYPTVCKIYMKAFDAARNAKHPKLQVQTLKSLIELQKVSQQAAHQQETEKKLAIVKRKFNLQDNTSDDNSSENADDENDCDGEDAHEDKDGDISLSDLTVSEESEEDQETIPSSRKKSKLARRNEKGETPLHRACIDGNLKKVKSLIMEGHPVNPRDFCGWLPLHEACNHGHLAVVQHVLDSGAWINDRGGERCGGVTPLIDAASCGNLEIVKLLVERGANVLAKDDDGNSALDSLHAWYSRTGDVLGSQDQQEYRAVKKLLSNKSAGSGPSTSSNVKSSRASFLDIDKQSKSSGEKNTTPAKRTVCLPDLSDSGGESDEEESATGLKKPTDMYRKRLTILRQKRGNKQPRRKQPNEKIVGHQLSEEELSDDGNIYYPPQLSPSLSGLKPDVATQVYRSTISQIGSSAQRRLEAEEASAMSEDSADDNGDEVKLIPALVTAEEDVGDDWLVNDVQYPRAKKKSTALTDIFTTTSSRLPRGDKRKRARNDEKNSGRASKFSSLLEKRRKSSQAFHNQGSSSSCATLDCDKIVTERCNVDENSSEACPVSSSTEVTNRTESMMETSENLIYAWDSDDDLLCQIDTIYNDDSFNTSQATPSQSLDHFNKSVSNPLTTPTPNRIKEHNSLIAHRNKVQGEHGTLRSSKTQSGISSIDRSSPISTHTTSVMNTEPLSNKFSSKQIETPQHPVIESSEKPTYKNSMRIKVKVGAHMLLIPIQPSNQENQLAWLIQQARDRYFNMFLMLPTLTLSTQDGTILCPSDTISMVLLDGEVLTANVNAWERPRLEDRYTQACNLSQNAPAKAVCTALQQCDTSGHLHLGDMGLGFSHVQPVFQALEGQKTLTELKLNGNRLGDCGIESLMKIVSSLPVLKVLMLDTNGLSANGVQMMARALKEELVLQSLTTLSLSHNCLDDIAAESLAVVVTKLPELHSLNLSSCNFSAKLFNTSLTEAFRGCHLTHLNMAENKLEDKGLRSLLPCLHPEHLLSLDISYTRTSVDQDMLQYLQDFIDKDMTCLRELSLAGCHLSDTDVTFVNRLPMIAKSLQSLNISQNQKVNNRSLQKLLYLSADGGSNLEELSVRGCSITSPLGSELMEATRAKMRAKVPLVKLAFSCRGITADETLAVQEIWMDKWHEQGQMKTVGMSVSLSVL